MKRIAAATALALLTLVGCASDEVPDTQTAIEERLTCQCGCGLTVHTCNHLQCGFAIPVKKDITESLAAGQTADEILERYLAEYGEKILSSPTSEGFNLLAWYGPYIALAVGILVLVFALRRWRRLAQTSARSSENASDGISEEQRRRLHDELEGLDR